MPIILFSKPIRSGKTTSLLSWCEGKKEVEGILMPDVDGKRKMLDIASHVLFEAEVTEKQTTQPVTAIGKYQFYTAAFEKANAILINAISNNATFIIVDEVGKLELKQKGFYPAVASLIAAVHQNKITSTVILVVRDSFVEEVVKFFSINDYRLTDDISMV